MSTQHTPGPWEARYSITKDYWFIDREQGGESYTLTTLDGGVCEADARLIAASPDLLAALEAMIEHYATPTSERSAASYSKTKAQVADEARAAIAKGAS